MIGNIYIVKLKHLLVFIAALNVAYDLFFDLPSLKLSRIITIPQCMLHLESFKAQSMSPVSVEFSDFLSLKERWLTQFLAPERSIRELVCQCRW